MKLFQKEKQIEIQSGRFLHGYVFQDDCPECGRTETLGEERGSSFSYPVLNQGMAINFRCQNCEHEWDQWIKIKMEIVDANAEE